MKRISFISGGKPSYGAVQGDEVEIEVDAIGGLRNGIRDE